MAKEWYLLKTPYDQLSGFESDAFDDFAQEGFFEALDSSIAVNVGLFNCDLTMCLEIRAIIQNNVQDTKLKTLVRELFVPIGTCKAGMYVKYNGRYWLIVGLVDDNGMYEKGVMILCNYLLTWVNAKQEIIQRWANVSSASQYNNGETGNYYYTIRSDQLLILTPNDDECVLLTSGNRFIIDKRCRIYEKEFDNSITRDTSRPVLTYELTRADSVLYDYQDSGHFEFLATQDEQHQDDGYYVVGGQGYWLCSKVDSSYKKDILSSRIECDSTVIYNGLEPNIFTAKFYDENGAEINATPNWEIRCDFGELLDIEQIGNSICISADNKKLINKSFELLLSADGYEPQSETITIRAFI